MIESLRKLEKAFGREVQVTLGDERDDTPSVDPPPMSDTRAGTGRHASDAFVSAGVGHRRRIDGRRVVAFVAEGNLHLASERFFQLAQRFDHQEARREPHRSAPVAVSPFQLLDRLGGLVRHRRIAERER
ncbi:MAG TPA: hypothetical protein VGJ82_21070, partial [Thermoanaerobaculia bacterium]